MDPAPIEQPPIDANAPQEMNVGSRTSADILRHSENTNNENRAKELAAIAGNDEEHAHEEEDARNADLPAAGGEQQQLPDAAMIAVMPAENEESTNANDAETDRAKSDESVVNVEATGNDRPETGDDYAQHVTYDADGLAIYTDPNTQQRFRFDEAKYDWVPLDAESAVPVPENEHYTFDAKLYQWIPKAAAYEVQTTQTTDGKWLHTHTDKDGVVFFWDDGQRAWFPQIDEDFMAKYQMGYGNYVPSDDDEEEEIELLEKLLASKRAANGDESTEATLNGGESTPSDGNPTAKRKKQPDPPKWFELTEEKNTKVYVSNLPTDIVEADFIELMSKYGMISRDPGSDKMKVKLYSEPDGQLKGDGLCTYLRIESVDICLKLLDGADYRGRKVHVERAKFQMRGEYNPALRPKKRKKDKERMKKMQEKLFDWRPEKMRGERSKNERIVIIKNLFEPEVFEKEVQLIIDFQRELREECEKCGTVRKVTLYDQHPEGVAQVNMSDPEEADVVVQMMHKRFFGKRQLTAELWDGKTKYKVEETKGEESKRLANWDQFLVEDEAESEETTETSDKPETTRPPMQTT